MAEQGQSSAAQPPKAAHHSPDARPPFLVTLGLVPPCTVEDVKQAFLAKVKTAHPDHGGDPAEFLKLQEAFENATEWAQFRASRLAWLGNWVEKYVEQDSLVAEIQRRGGLVHVAGVDWLRRSFGEDFSQVAEKVTGIELRGRNVDDGTLAWLANHRNSLSSLKSLILSGTAITDTGVLQLSAFPALQELVLSDTKVGAAGLIVVDQLPELKRLVVHNTEVGLLTRLKLRLRHRKIEVVG